MSSHDAAFDALHEFFIRCSTEGDSDSVDHLVELDMSLSQVKTLFVLAHADEPLPINVLADRIRLSVAAAGRTVDLLVTAGLVERAESVADRRVKLVTLTTSGRDITAAHVDDKKAAMKAQIARLSDSQADQLARALAPLASNHPHEQETPA